MCVCVCVCVCARTSVCAYECVRVCNNIIIPHVYARAAACICCLGCRQDNPSKEYFCVAMHGKQNKDRFHVCVDESVLLSIPKI